MAAHIDEQVFLEDINEQQEMALDCWKVTFGFYQRLQHQGADPMLLSEMVTIINHFSGAYEALKRIIECFPPSDGRPAD